MFVCNETNLTKLADEVTAEHAKVLGTALLLAVAAREDSASDFPVSEHLSDALAALGRAMEALSDADASIRLAANGRGQDQAHAVAVFSHFADALRSGRFEDVANPPHLSTFA